MWIERNQCYILGAIHLAGQTAKISKGLCKLSLAHCGITSKGINQIAQSLTQNLSICGSLTHLDLSGNSLKDDINNLYNFLAQPNVLENLNICNTDTPLESVSVILKIMLLHLPKTSKYFFLTAFWSTAARMLNPPKSPQCVS